jgi:nicotinate-nucleotide adenylyltransferase
MQGMIALFGGSFDPIHQGHLHLAQQILSDYPIDKFYFVPARKNPNKTKEPGASAEDRLEMVKKAVCAMADPRVECLDWEIMRPGPSYTVITLEELKKKTSGPVALIMGNDVFQGLPRWRTPLKVLHWADCVVVMRSGETGFDATKILGQLGIDDAVQCQRTGRWVHSAGLRWVERKDVSVLPYSSTQLRRQLMNAWSQSSDTGRRPSGISPEVWLYIKEKRLYAVSKK